MVTSTEVQEYPEHEKLKAIRGKNQGLGHWIENCGWRGEKTLEKILMAIIYLDDGEDTDERRPNREEIIKFLNWFMDYKKKLKKQNTFFERNVSKILAAYYDIDEQKLDDEKRVILGSIRKVNKAS